MGDPLFPDGGRSLPRVARGDPAAGARMLADEIPAAIALAEALGAIEVVERLHTALLAAEWMAVNGERSRAEVFQ